MFKPPSLSQIEQTAALVSEHLVRTPTVPYYGNQLTSGVDGLYLKLELLQRTGSFKPRGVLNALASLSSAELARGVTAFSAGNHAIATAFAAQKFGVSAKVVMPETANPLRVERCRSYGAEVLFGKRISDLISLVGELQEQEGRAMLHPFEGAATAQGTATVGLEVCRDAGELDAVIVPVGGGGLIAGVASAVKALLPQCAVYGVEPEGACGMRDSLERGAPLDEVHVNTIADSLGAPMHTPYAFAIVQQTVDRLVTVSDQALAETMNLMFTDLKLAVEPAGAASLAAFLGPLHQELQGKRVGLVICGANIDFQSYSTLVNPIAGNGSTG